MLNRFNAGMGVAERSGILRGKVRDIIICPEHTGQCSSVKVTRRIVSQTLIDHYTAFGYLYKGDINY